MKIVFVITLAEHGGAQVHLLDLISKFSNGNQITVIVGCEGYLTQSMQKAGIPFYVLPNIVQPISLLKDTLAVFDIIHMLKQLNPDIVHSHSSKAGTLARLAAVLSGFPVVFTAHGWAFADGVSRKQLWIAIPTERLFAPLAKRIITVSEQDRRLALRYGISKAERLIVIHNGLSDVAERAIPGSDGEVRIIMVARFSVPKMQADLIYACAKLDASRVVFVGDGRYLEPARELAMSLSMNDRVEFLGTRDDVPRVLADSHIFALISNYEGFPLSILEAMRAGLPVIASDVGGVREAVVDGETGFLIPRGDINTLRDRLQRLVLDPALRERMGRAGRARFEAHFTLDRMLEQTWEVYQQVLSRN